VKQITPSFPVLQRFNGSALEDKKKKAFSFFIVELYRGGAN